MVIRAILMIENEKDKSERKKFSVGRGKL